MATAVLPVMQSLFADFGTFQPTCHGSGTGANTDSRDDGQLTHTLALGGGRVINLAIVRQELKVRYHTGKKANGWDMIITCTFVEGAAAPNDNVLFAHCAFKRHFPHVYGLLVFKGRRAHVV